MTKPQFYKPSGRAPSVELVKALVGGLLGGVVGGWVYSLGCGLNPIFWLGWTGLRILVLAGVLWNSAAFSVGWLIATFVSTAAAGGIRSPAVGRLLGLSAGVLYLVGAYHFWLSMYGLPAPWEPVALGKAVRAALAGVHPLYEIPGRGKVFPLEGLFFWGPCAVEAVAVLVLSSWMGAFGSTTPYCETCDQECQPQDLPPVSTGKIKLAAVAALITQVKERRFEGLLSEEPPVQEGAIHVRLHCCSECDQSNYLTAEVQFLEAGTAKDATEEASRELEILGVVAAMKVDASEVERLLAAHGLFSAGSGPD